MQQDRVGVLDSSEADRRARKPPYFRLVLRVVHLPLTHVPTAPIVATTATTRIPRRTVYSIRAAPLSSRANFRIVCIFLSVRASGAAADARRRATSANNRL